MSAPSSARQFPLLEPVELDSEDDTLQPALDIHPQARTVLNRVLARCGTVEDGVVPRDAIHPQDFAVALTNIAMIDIRYDDDGGFSAYATIVGEELSSRYGLRRGPVASPPAQADANKRFSDVVLRIHAIRRPLVVRVSQLSPDRPHLEARGLYIPYTRSGGPIDGVLLHAVVASRR